MKTIYKYPIRLTDIQHIVVPENAKILSCKLQNNDICLWAEVETKNKYTKREVQIIGTGNPIEELKGHNRKFIDTVIVNDFVWHIFELEKIL